MADFSAEHVIASLKDRGIAGNFIALGQTALWDEPVKAAWVRTIQKHWPDSIFTAGVHDTDYFAKSTARVVHDGKYAVLPHNDGATRGLWSAAAELSALFGSEDLPTRNFFESLGIPFNKLTHSYPAGKARFYEDKTEAWGWRAIVQTGSEPPITHDIPLSEFGGELLSQFRWGLDQSLASIAHENRPAADVQAKILIDEVDTYLRKAHSDASLTDLYKHLLKFLYTELLGEVPELLSITNSVSLFQFNMATADRPLFRFLTSFLDTRTAAVCREAYDSAVSGGGMYTLSGFGEGALPFDIVVPGRGRGTLRIESCAVRIDFKSDPMSIDANATPTSSAELAAILEPVLGPGIALVGKAVALIDMLAAEFVIVFHETASSYTVRTEQMNTHLRRQGITLNLNPIVRLSYPTWDSLSAPGDAVAFKLPSHLASAFESTGNDVSGTAFASGWRKAVESEKATLKTLSQTVKLRDRLTLLESRPSDDMCWQCLCEDYDRASAELGAMSASAQPLRDRIAELQRFVKDQRSLSNSLHRDMGTNFREKLQPLIRKIKDSAINQNESALHDQIERETNYRAVAFERPIADCRRSIADAHKTIRQLRREKHQIETSPQSVAAREVMRNISTRVEYALVDVARSAFLTAHGLPHTNARPSAWWLRLVDPSGKWFAAMADGVAARLEEL